MSVWKETGDDGSSPTIAQTQGAELSMETRTTGTGAAITPSEIRDLATPLTDDASIDRLLHRSVMPDSFFGRGVAWHGQVLPLASCAHTEIDCRTRLLFHRGGRRLAQLLPGESLGEWSKRNRIGAPGRAVVVRPVADLDVGECRGGGLRQLTAHVQRRDVCRRRFFAVGVAVCRVRLSARASPGRPRERP
jgi:hypothetical protein